MDGERIADLVLHLARAMSRPLGEDDDLVFRQVGNGIHGRGVCGVHAPEREREPGRDDGAPVANREGDQAFDHATAFPRRASRWSHGDFGLERYLSGDFLSRSSHPSQQSWTVWPLTVTETGGPIEPSGLPVTGQTPCLGSDQLVARWAGRLVARGSTRSKVACGEARIQSRLRVQQESAADRDALAGFESARHRIDVAAARADDDLHAVEHPGHSLDEHDRAGACIDHGRFGHGEHLARRPIRDDPRDQLPAAAGLARRFGVIGRDVRVHRAPPVDALIVEQGLALQIVVAVDRATPALGCEHLRVLGADVDRQQVSFDEGRRIGRKRAERLKLGDGPAHGREDPRSGRKLRDRTLRGGSRHSCETHADRPPACSLCPGARLSRAVVESDVRGLPGDDERAVVFGHAAFDQAVVAHDADQGDLARRRPVVDGCRLDAGELHAVGGDLHPRQHAGGEWGHVADLATHQRHVADVAFARSHRDDARVHRAEVFGVRRRRPALASARDELVRHVLPVVAQRVPLPGHDEHDGQDHNEAKAYLKRMDHEREPHRDCASAA